MTNTQPSIKVIDRAVRLLDAIAAEGPSASLTTLATATGLHPSSAHRILSALVETGIVERAQRGTYQLGSELVRFASHVPHHMDLRERARDAMGELRSRVGEAVNLTVREGDSVVYVERALPNRIMRVEQVIGSRAPLHVTAVGKIMLAELGDQFLLGYAERTGLPRFTRHTLTDLSTLRREVDMAGLRGFASDNEEAEEGVGCLGVPLRDALGEIIAGLSISAPVDRLKNEWVPLLQDAARRISG